MPKSHSDFWRTKIERNVQRDERKNGELVEAGWTVITIWECELKKERDWAVMKLRDVLDEAHR
ncbi:hypothetical protein [Methanomethylophilus alvi]|uniref:hypothetical protein n=1 Tax=Methanomethylophilus alvi TaxID=1291540 RepID=UPI0037DD0523